MIPLFKVFMSDEAVEDSGRVLKSGYITQGPRVEEFEKNLVDFLGYDRLITVSSGTAALHLAFRLIEKSEGEWPGFNRDTDVVLTTALTCTATNWAVLANNYKLKWVDVDPESYNISLDDLEAKLTPRTKAIMFVHWGGVPVDLNRVAQIREKCFKLYGFRPYVIEDCAHAFGANYSGQMLGSHGNICCFSFQAIKHLTAVDGGMLSLPNDELYRRGKLIRWFGIDRNQRDNNRGDFRLEADVPEYGYKFHMNDVSAAIGLANLPHVAGILQRCRDNARFYDEHLVKIAGLSVQAVCPDSRPAYWLYSMKVDRKHDFIVFMKECGVMVSQVHGRNDHHSCVAEFKQPLPVLDDVESKLICIPVGWWVTDADREHIVSCIKKFFS